MYKMKFGNQVKLIITDFDGTLVDTFTANYKAYKNAFNICGLNLDIESYKRCFGYRYEKFIALIGIKDADVSKKIRQLKISLYPKYFEYFKLNKPLLDFLLSFRSSGGKIAIASTARRNNLQNALDYLGLSQSFDYVLAGEEVSEGKPSPEIYIKVLNHFKLSPNEALVFEDSEIGMEASKRAGINFIHVNNKFYGN